MNGFGFSAMVVILLVVLLSVLVTCGVKPRPDDNIKPVLIDRNSIGCSKYSFKGDQYWKCPKELEINYFEEIHSNGKTTSTRYVPVAGI